MKYIDPGKGRNKQAMRECKPSEYMGKGYAVMPHVDQGYQRFSGKHTESRVLKGKRGHK
jgi:hypothetical protein